jgi:flagellar basal body-associated protein FliL
MDNNLLLILIAVAIFLIIIVAVLIILLMARKMQGSKSIGTVQENFAAPQQPQHPSQLFCTNCGASRSSTDGAFCKKCGHRYES